MVIIILVSEYEISEDIRFFHSFSLVTFYDFSADEIPYLELVGEWIEYPTTS